MREEEENGGRGGEKKGEQTLHSSEVAFEGGKASWGFQYGKKPLQCEGELLLEVEGDCGEEIEVVGLPLSVLTAMIGLAILLQLLLLCSLFFLSSFSSSVSPLLFGI